MALIRKYQLVYHPDKDIQDIQKNIKESFDSLQNVPFLDGVWIKDITVTTAAVNIAHGLNRPWRGYFITKINDNVLVWANPTQADASRFITLDADNNVTIDLWVF